MPVSEFFKNVWQRITGPGIPPPSPVAPGTAGPSPLVGVGPQDLPVRGLGVALLTLYLLAITWICFVRLLDSWPELQTGCRQTEALFTPEDPWNTVPRTFAKPGAAPVISGIEPKSGPPAGGNPVTIHGTGFTEKVAVAFGETQSASVQPQSSTSIRVVAPPSSGDTAQITVTNDTGPSNPVTYVYRPSRPISLESVSPEFGELTGGKKVFIKGSGFLEQPTVTFGGIPASGVQITKEGVLAKTPRHPAGPVNVEVRNSDGQSGTLQAAYLYTCPTGYDKNLFLAVLLAGVLGGTLHAMRSLFWYRGTKTLVRSWILMYILLPFTGGLIAAAFYLIVRAGIFHPEGGSGDLLVIGIAILVGMFSDQATEKLKKIGEAILTEAPKGVNQAPPAPTGLPATQTGSAPTVNTVDPNIGSISGGELVTLAGSGFSASDAVTFGGQPASIQSSSPSALKVKTPANPQGWVDVKVASASNHSHMFPKGYLYTPVSPGFGPKAGGTPVTIKGANFTATSTVTFGGVAATNPTFVDPQTLTAVTPPMATEGIVAVKVIDGGNSLLNVLEGFKYTA
jgi:hypothetical protein